MHRFRVWAPNAQTMKLKLANALLAMTGPDKMGWWQL